jgi:hypothetical protein
MLKKRFHG